MVMNRGQMPKQMKPVQKRGKKQPAPMMPDQDMDMMKNGGKVKGKKGC